MAASAPPRMIWCAAMAIAWSPEEQKRLTVVPAIETGSPARTSATRATLLPCGAVRLGAAQDHVLDLGRVELRDLAEHVLDAVGGQVVRAGSC